MALINTTTTGVLGSTFYGDGSGNLTVQQNGVTLQTITSAPSFSAYQSSAQTVGTGWTKIQFQTEEWDTANCFDNSTNYRFTPNVAGYYQVSGGFYYVTGTTTESGLSIYKNNSSYRYLNDMFTSNNRSCNGSAMIYLNGTTDYIELYGYSSTGGTLATGTIYNYFQAFLTKAS